ncbi:hypothetical protein [Bradymonas sediminis]|uniref:Glycosyltransferase RgtA/B/C/D-like domain-containing protein n=1 Tax=Bradymonas sediminis TaxID=1548548 RepID=A0A2Z4FIF0_9DELT|nr:hypothetical protein [Bradymonas sediminis]AWV88585.1 hypothetical protein DN745_04225 [Bradymonas sediminis]
MAAWLLYRLYILIGNAWTFTTDDAYITLRYARNMAAGKGLMWNPGDFPVEGYSNFLYVLIGAASYKSGLDPVFVVKLVGVASLVLTCMLTFAIARRWVGPLGALLPTALLTGYRGTTLWAVSGMETALYLCLGLTAIWLFMVGCESAQIGIRPPRAESDPDAPRWTLAQRHDSSVFFALCGGALFLAALTRLEGPIFGIIVLGSLVAVGATRLLKNRAGATENLKPIVQAITVLTGTFVLPYTVYFAWRWQYFGRFLPNTYYCKANAPGSPWTLLGWYWDDAFLLVLLALVFPWRKIDIRATALFALVLAYAVLLYGADTIVAYEMRLAMVAFAALSILASVSALSWVKHAWGAIPTRAAALLFLFTVLIWQGELPNENKYLKDYSAKYAKRMALRAELGKWVDARLGPEDWFVIGDAGIAPFHTDAQIADPFCLNSWRYTSDEMDKDMSIYVNWVITLKPKMIAVHSKSNRTLKPRREYGFYPKLVADPRFEANYKLTKKFSPGSGEFHYWIYTRQ